jgi:hypothetical protein
MSSMSNNDDFDFNRDDLFDDFDDDSGGDDFGGDDFNSDDFDFGDDNEDFNLDDDNSFSDIDSALADDDDFGGGDDFGATETTATGGGSNRNFIFGVIALLLVFAVGIGLIIWLSTRVDPETAAFLTEKADIETRNAIALTDIAASSTAAVDQATSTQSAIETATAGFTPASETPTPTLTPTEDLTATALEQQNQQIFQQQTVDAQAAIDATNTEISFQQTLNPQATVPTLEATVDTGISGAPTSEATVSISSVQQTATALAILFSTPPTQAGVQATNIVDGTPIVIGGSTQIPGTDTTGQGNGEALPDTGLFDDVFQGNPTVIFVAAFGLLGVIVFSRTVRSRKRKDD